MQVGQTLWYVPFRRGEPREVTVTKVGRLWGSFDAEYSGGRFDLKTLRIDNSTGQLYLNREVYERDVFLRKAWGELRKEIDRTYSPPPGVTINQVDNAMRSLFKRGADQSSESPK